MGANHARGFRRTMGPRRQAGAGGGGQDLHTEGKKQQRAQGLQLRNQTPMQLLQQEPGERHGKHTERREAEQQNAQLHADGLSNAHEGRDQDHQNQQVVDNDRGRPGGDPDICGAHALQELLGGGNRGSFPDALRVAGMRLGRAPQSRAWMVATKGEERYHLRATIAAGP